MSNGGCSSGTGVVTEEAMVGVGGHTVQCRVVPIGIRREILAFIATEVRVCHLFHKNNGNTESW
jgi:hypothetical protein